MLIVDPALGRPVSARVPTTSRRSQLFVAPTVGLCGGSALEGLVRPMDYMPTPGELLEGSVASRSPGGNFLGMDQLTKRDGVRSAMRSNRRQAAPKWQAPGWLRNRSRTQCWRNRSCGSWNPYSCDSTKPDERSQTELMSCRNRWFRRNYCLWCSR